MTALGRVEIDLGALARNYQIMVAAAAPGACGAVVKANAYGLGVEAIARELQQAGCEHFFVATVDEGIELREILPAVEIFVLDGTQGSPTEIFQASKLTPVLNSRADLRRWGSAGPAAVHVDTGMSRLGLSRSDIDALRLERDRMPAVDVRYVMTHFACADEPVHELNEAQADRFRDVCSLWPNAKTSAGNSAGMLLGDKFKSDLARPGIALYGANPFYRAPSPVEPVVQLKARILQLRDIGPGESVGYGATFVANEPVRVATLGIGYADGYLRSLSNCGIAEVAGQRAPVVGRISMDLTSVDVSAVPREAVAEGDWVTLIGGSVSLEEVAALAGTINYELLTALGSRLERVYKSE